MKLLDYIRGLRKGKEAHRLEKESMKDPFLADAMEGYSQVEGSHEQQIEKMRAQIAARAAQPSPSVHSSHSKKKNTFAITWSIAASLVIGIGIGSYFLFLKKGMNEDVFIADETLYSEEMVVKTPKENEEMAAAPAVKTKQDSAHEVAMAVKPKAAPLAAAPIMEEAIEATAIEPTAVMADENAISADTSHSVRAKHKMRIAQASSPKDNKIKGRITDEKGEPIVGASVSYKGTTVGTVTDLNGEFSITKKEGNDKLTAQFIGFNTVEIPVDTSKTMLIAMNADNQKLDEVVVVGYGKKKKDVEVRTPEPVIGMRKYRKYLKENLIRPTDKACADAEGKVVLTFLVDAKGRPYQIEVKDSLCESCDKEAIRLVQEGPDWTIGNQSVEVTIKF